MSARFEPPPYMSAAGVRATEPAETSHPPTLVVALHDGFYGCGTGAGIANRAFLRCLTDILAPGVRLVVAPIRLTVDSPEYDHDWHDETRRILNHAPNGVEVRPVENGTMGRARFGGIDCFRRAADDTARLLIGEIRPIVQLRMIIAFDVPFLGLAPHLPDAAVRDLVLVPRATARQHDPTNRIRIAWESYGLESAANRGGRIACISAHMRDHLRTEYGLPNHALVDLPDGLVPDDHHQPGPWPELPPDAGSGFLLAMGRAEPYKGFDDLLAALTQLTRTGTPLPHVVIAAVSNQQVPTAYQQHLAHRAYALDLPITMLTRFRPNLRALLWHPDLRGVILPSRAEPFGRIPLEAYAAGATPVVATDVGGLAETVRDRVTGYTARPADPASLADAIIRALAATDADRHRMRAASRKLLHSRYHYPDAVARFLAAYAPWAVARRPPARDLP